MQDFLLAILNVAMRVVRTCQIQAGIYNMMWTLIVALRLQKTIFKDPICVQRFEKKIGGGGGLSKASSFNRKYLN